MKDNGIITLTSKASVKETVDYLSEFLINHGATIYARIDQKTEAGKAGIELSDMEYLLFGNPAKGALLLKNEALIGLDLPLKILCYQLQGRKTLVAFNDAEFISSRYGIPLSEDSILNLQPMISYVLKNQIP